jgi:hypothetical protein
MNTKRLKPISGSTFYVRLLHNVAVDNVNEVCTYTKLGVRKTIKGSDFYRLKYLVEHNKSSNQLGCRYAMGFKNHNTGQCCIAIDRAFYDDF